MRSSWSKKRSLLRNAVCSSTTQAQGEGIYHDDFAPWKSWLQNSPSLSVTPSYRGNAIREIVHTYFEP